MSWVIYKHWIPIIYFCSRLLYVRFYPHWSPLITLLLCYDSTMWTRWLNAYTYLCSNCAVYEVLKTSDDSETRGQKVCECASEEFTSCQLLLLWLEQSRYVVSWWERDKGNYLGERKTCNIAHTYKLPTVFVSDAQNNLKCLITFDVWNIYSSIHLFSFLEIYKISPFRLSKNQVSHI